VSATGQRVEKKSRTSLLPWAVAPAVRYPYEFTTLKHEIVHYIASVAVPHQPPWFSEGIAMFFQTADFDREGRFQVGLVPKDYYRVLKYGVLPMSSLLAARIEKPDAQFYASAWLLVHYLMTQHADRFSAYQRALAAGATFEQAWSQAFAFTPASAGGALCAHR
jgi:hypothetical protein